VVIAAGSISSNREKSLRSNGGRKSVIVVVQAFRLSARCRAQLGDTRRDIREEARRADSRHAHPHPGWETGAIEEIERTGEFIKE
jgi:hypothetical protein